MVREYRSIECLVWSNCGDYMSTFLKGNRKLSRPTIWAAIYMCALLLLFFFGVLENKVDSEGMGFFPLLALTTPWSWLLMGLWDSPIWGNTLAATHLAIFITCNVISGTLNGYILYFLLNRWQKKDVGTQNDK